MKWALSDANFILWIDACLKQWQNPALKGGKMSREQERIRKRLP